MNAIKFQSTLERATVVDSATGLRADPAVPVADNFVSADSIPAEIAAAPKSPPAPGAAANRSKRETKTCEHCGNLFVRSIHPSGTMEGKSAFAKRVFCSRRCSNVVRTQRSLQMRLPSKADAPFHCPPDAVISLPMPPTTNNLFAGNKRRFRSPAYKAWITEAGLLLNRQQARPVSGRVHLLIEVEEPKTARRMDVANREKATTDLLVSHGIIEGDDQRFVREITMRWADVSGVRITIRGAA